MRIFNRQFRQASLALIAVAVITALNIAAQMILFRHTLSEGAVTSYLPVYTDSADYMGRAERLADGEGFEEVFCNGLRMPGYPLFLSFFARLSGNPAPVVRIVQILFSSSLILMSWFILSTLTRSAAVSLAGAFLCAIWLPFYYFSPVLYAESVCIALMGLLLLTLSRFDPERPARTLVISAVLTAALIYMKPNHILLLPVLMVFCIQAAGKGLRAGVRIFLVPALIVIMLLSPWTAFVSRCQQAPVMLTTHGGWNLFLGSGGGHQYSGAGHQGSLSTRTWKYLELRDDEDSNAAYEAAPAGMRAQADREYRQKAIDRWKKQPLKLTAYGLSKVLHVFGFSMRGPRDAIVMIHFLISMAFSIVLWKCRRWREWSLLLWSITFITAAQAFIFLGELRFKTVLFDLPALVVSLLGALVFLQLLYPSRFGGADRPVSGR